MNYMQKMKIDPNTVEGLLKLQRVECSNIHDEIRKKYAKNGNQCPNPKIDCCRCIAMRLTAEVPTKKVKRWETYEGDFVKALKCLKEVCKHNKCDSCEIRDICSGNTLVDIFALWLMEEVEV